MHRLGLLTSFGVIIAFLAGCTKPGDIPPTHKVEGKVIDKDGKPYSTGGAIIFHHDTKDHITAGGEIKSDGTFTLQSTFGFTKVSGAVEGSYKVTIIPKSPGVATPPVSLQKKHVVEPRDNNLTIEIGS